VSSYESGLETRDYVVKKWGMEEILVNNEQYCSKLLWITPGFQCSLHYHSIKHETFIALDGLTRVEYYIGDKRFDTVLAGWRRDVLDLPPGTPHRFWSFGRDGSLLLEVSTPHSDADVTRIEDSKELVEDDGKS
jgi:mannose-6-phosphate isomerase-like protein (cupin superfamily)